MRVELYGCYGKVSPQLLHNFKLIISKYIISTSSSGGRGGGGEGNGGGVKKSFSALLRASVWSKNNLRRVGEGGRGGSPGSATELRPQFPLTNLLTLVNHIVE